MIQEDKPKCLSTQLYKGLCGLAVMLVGATVSTTWQTPTNSDGIQHAERHQFNPSACFVLERVLICNSKKMPQIILTMCMCVYVCVHAHVHTHTHRWILYVMAVMVTLITLSLHLKNLTQLKIKINCYCLL